MRRPRLLDLYCGAGGCSVGYWRAGFAVVGVDIEDQPAYPFRFEQADALEYPLDDFDVIHASPPCQRYSVANNIHGRDDHPDLIAQTRERLEQSGAVWVMENVPGAPLHRGPASLFDDRSGVTVCGLALGLGVKRHRWFESNVPLVGTVCPIGHPGEWLLVFGHSVLGRGRVIGKAIGGGNRIHRDHLQIDRGAVAMGIDWMTRDELSQAIPPAYTEWIGAQLLERIAAGKTSAAS
jgi:DNA (cytosine-5)-methyltransferase 1